MRSSHGPFLCGCIAVFILGTSLTWLAQVRLARPANALQTREPFRNLGNILLSELRGAGGVVDAPFILENLSDRSCAVRVDRLNCACLALFVGNKSLHRE